MCERLPNDALLYAEIERLDRELLAVPIFIRQLDIYNEVVGREERDDTALSYLAKISAWYQKRYGAEAAWDGVIGLQPVFFRERVYVFEVRHSDVNPKNGVDDLREKLEGEGLAISPEEHQQLGVAHLESHHDFSAFYNIEMRPSLFTKEQRALARRAWFDLKNAIVVLQTTQDVQGSVVFSHQAVEKFLKIALIHEGTSYSELGRGDLRHNLNDLIRALVKKHSKYKYIKRVARDMHDIFGSMTKQRYERVDRTPNDAVNAFRFARHCCAFVAMQIELDHDRGARDIDLKIGRYYKDYAGRQFRFCGYDKKPDGAIICRLFLLEAQQDGNTLDAELNAIAPCSFHYSEIADRSMIARLEARYSSIRQRSRQTIPPELSGISVKPVPESFDGIFSLRIPVNKATENIFKWKDK